MTNKSPEFLITAQVYEKTDPYKQTLLVHDVLHAQSEKEAKEKFNDKFEQTHNIVNIYSAINVENNKI